MRARRSSSARMASPSVVGVVVADAVDRAGALPREDPRRRLAHPRRPVRPVSSDRLLRRPRQPLRHSHRPKAMRTRRAISNPLRIRRPRTRTSRLMITTIRSRTPMRRRNLGLTASRFRTADVGVVVVGDVVAAVTAVRPAQLARLRPRIPHPQVPGLKAISHVAELHRNRLRRLRRKVAGAAASVVRLLSLPTQVATNRVIRRAGVAISRVGDRRGSLDRIRVATARHRVRHQTPTPQSPARSTHLLSGFLRRARRPGRLRSSHPRRTGHRPSRSARRLFRLER